MPLSTSYLADLRAACMSQRDDGLISPDLFEAHMELITGYERYAEVCATLKSLRDRLREQAGVERLRRNRFHMVNYECLASFATNILESQ